LTLKTLSIHYSNKWANQVKHVLEQALTAANAIGGDRLQNGISQQRIFWFKKGLTEGTVQSCITFDTDYIYLLRIFNGSVKHEISI